MADVSVGEVYEVLVVRYGTRPADRSGVFLNYDLYGEPDGPIGMDYFFWVVRNERRTVVVDTGFSRSGGERRGRTMLVDPCHAFSAFGVLPADGPTVVVTHAHYDHIGNLSSFDQSPVVVAAAELAFWYGPHARHAQFHHSVDDEDLAGLTTAMRDGRVVTFEERHDVADGIEVLRVGGHTPGQSMVRVRTAAGNVLLASDAVHYYEEFERAMPFVSAANLVEMYAAFDTIRAMVDGGLVDHVVTGHDPATLGRFPVVEEVAPVEAAVIGRVAP